MNRRKRGAAGGGDASPELAIRYGSDNRQGNDVKLPQLVGSPKKIRRAARRVAEPIPPEVLQRQRHERHRHFGEEGESSGRAEQLRTTRRAATERPVERIRSHPLIGRKQYETVQSIFRDHDLDRDGRSARQ